MRSVDLPTPALVLDGEALEHNIATMAARWPGTTLRPHSKCFKSTVFAGRLADAGHTAFCCATIREVEGLAAAGLGDDLLLANEVLDTARLGALVEDGHRITVAVDSDETVDAAARGGVREVLVDVNVGFRCGCPPDEAGRLADRARAAGLTVRGVMAYEAHAVLVEDRGTRADLVEGAMARARTAHAQVGGEVVSGGGTGSWDLNDTITELQAGSYLLMDTAYAELDLPVPSGPVRGGHGHLGQRRGRRGRCRHQGPRPGPRSPRPCPAPTSSTARTSTSQSSPTTDGRPGSVSASGSPPPTATPRSPSTSATTWSGATRSSTNGPSTSGTGEDAAPNLACPTRR